LSRNSSAGGWRGDDEYPSFNYQQTPPIAKIKAMKIIMEAMNPFLILSILHPSSTTQNPPKYDHLNKPFISLLQKCLSQDAQKCPDARLSKS
jgi:hypothetical protein